MVACLVKGAQPTGHWPLYYHWVYPETEYLLVLTGDRNNVFASFELVSTKNRKVNILR